METIIIAVNVILAVILIILVLLQRSEGGALGLGLSQDNFASFFHGAICICHWRRGLLTR